MEYQPPHRSSRREGAPLATDTIVATATPAGRGGVGMVRVSGPGAHAVALGTLGLLPAVRLPRLLQFKAGDGSAIDQGLALYFQSPHSFTGEDVLELHAHGSPVVLEALVSRAVELGARRAEPGEFTQRAFLNEKIDLAQAEAVADIIDASSMAAVRAALRSLQGEFSTQIRRLMASLTDLRAYVEAAIDFPEEEIDFLADAQLLVRLEAVRRQFDQLTGVARQGRLLTEGITVVIAGAPNAGKSTLLNRLAGYEAAIVTAVPGTTRDLLRERILIDGMPVQVIDTAGLRDSDDFIEREGVRRAEAEMARADQVLFVVDASVDPGCAELAAARARLPTEVPVIIVINKMDLVNADEVTLVGDVHLSAQTGEGMEALREHLKQSVGLRSNEAGTVAARARHLHALLRAREFVEAGARQLAERHAGELVAEELRAAQRALGEIVGDVSSDELLGHIFSRFCIGK
jgi:tRNA modification GTPase